MKRISFFLFISLWPTGFFYNICNSNNQQNVCTQLATSNDFKCNNNSHDIDCILHINGSKSHLGRISNEAATISSNFPINNVVVFAEIRKNHPPLSTVVIVRNNITEGLNNLQGKKFCHPGYKHDDVISYRILNELNDKLYDLDKNKFCSANNATIIEKQIKYLSNLFDSACIPGPWTQNSKLDNKLKEKYSSLCKLCGSSNCNVDYTNPFNDSMKCLLNNNADIALTTLEEAYKFFNTSNYSNQYKYLCKNGSTQSANNSCVWTSKFNDIIVGDRSVVTDLGSLLDKKLSLNNDAEANALKAILLKDDDETIIFLNDINKPSLSDYVKSHRDIPTIDTSKYCDLSIKLCTHSSLEQQKCQWFSQAVINQGIQPVLECVQGESTEDVSCINDIRKGQTDLFITSTDYAYLSYKNNLMPVAFIDQKESSSIMIAISESSNLASFKDLEGSRVCIPLYGGKEWLVFINTLQINKLVTYDTYENTILNYLGESCIPGALSSDYDSDSNQELCNLCIAEVQPTTAKYCTANKTNKYYGSDGSLECLYDSVADFAVITKEEVKRNVTKMKVLCKNGTLVTVNGLDVDDNCFLNQISSAVVIGKNSNKNEDIEVFISECDKWFSENSKIFSLYGSFNDTSNLLYKNSTVGQDLMPKSVYNENFMKLLKSVNNPKFSFSSSDSLGMSQFVVFQFLFVIYWLCIL